MTGRKGVGGLATNNQKIVARGITSKQAKRSSTRTQTILYHRYTIARERAET